MNNETSVKFKISQKQEVRGRKNFRAGTYELVSDLENIFSNEEIRSFSEISKLYDKLKHYTIKDAIKFEEADRQFIAIKKLYENIDKSLQKYYLALIVANALICYQLSSTGENYWEEFSSYFITRGIINNEQGIIKKLSNFIKKSKGNRRFLETKINRLEKLGSFLENFIGKEMFYFENMVKLRDILAKIMGQKKDAKTIVFAVKMFSYGARNVFGKIIYFPNDICIPIDSRLAKIFEKYSSFSNFSSKSKGMVTRYIAKFYFDLSKELNIPELHLDAIIWNSKDL